MKTQLNTCLGTQFFFSTKGCFTVGCGFLSTKLGHVKEREKSSFELQTDILKLVKPAKMQLASSRLLTLALHYHTRTDTQKTHTRTHTLIISLPHTHARTRSKPRPRQKTDPRDGISSSSEASVARVGVAGDVDGVGDREREREQKSSLNESHMSTISSKTSISLKVFGDSKCLLEKFPGGEILSCRSNHFE